MFHSHGSIPNKDLFARFMVFHIKSQHWCWFLHQAELEMFSSNISNFNLQGTIQFSLIGAFCLFFFFFYFLFVCLFVYLFMAVLGLRFCARALSSCGKRGPLFIAMRGPLTIAASPVAEHRLQTRRLSSCGSRAQLLRGMWDLPRPGLEPVSPALAGRFSTTAPPGKPALCLF